jgi:hypothetical protein
MGFASGSSKEDLEPSKLLRLRLADEITRIVDNAHLLDATEIFRKLNVHKKVLVSPKFLISQEWGANEPADRNHLSN